MHHGKEAAAPGVSSAINVPSPAQANGYNDPDLQPPSLVNPISVSRIQSALTPQSVINSALLVTFTVRNNLAPVMKPAITPGDTPTNTLAAVNAFIPTNDPNTAHAVLLADEFINAAALSVASVAPETTAGRLAWNLGDIAPLHSKQVVVTMSVPATANSTAFDSGITAWATWRGQQISAAAAPISLQPNNFAAFLRRTPEANTKDEVMLGQLSAVGSSANQIFAYVQTLGYETYPGSLRGTRGTLWSKAGNALDKSSLMIAMLRASNIPARYRHGTLTEAQAQALILSMFPQNNRVIGSTPSGGPVSDPAHDPVLLGYAQDHWWVEAYANGAWTDLDASFASAQPGQVLAATIAANATDRIAEIPDAQRHKVTITAQVEKYSVFDYAALGNNLQRSTPLSATFNASALVGAVAQRGKRECNCQRHGASAAGGCDGDDCAGCANGLATGGDELVVDRTQHGRCSNHVCDYGSGRVWRGDELCTDFGLVKPRRTSERAV